MLSLTSLAQNWGELCCQYASQMSPLARCYCQHQPGKYVAGCPRSSKPCTDLYFFIWQICLFLWKNCVDAVFKCLLVPDVSKTACPQCRSLPQCISEKHLAYQAARRGLMNRLCDLPPDRRKHRQQHWNQRQRQTVILRHSSRIMTCSHNMVRYTELYQYQQVLHGYNTVYYCIVLKWNHMYVTDAMVLSSYCSRVYTVVF